MFGLRTSAHELWEGLNPVHREDTMVEMSAHRGMEVSCVFRLLLGTGASISSLYLARVVKQVNLAKLEVETGLKDTICLRNC